MALEIHTLSQKLNDITEQVRKKVSSGGADGRGTVPPTPGPPLPFSWVLEAGPTRGPSVGLLRGS